MSATKQQYKFHIVYQTTNTINGMIYIGKRSTNKIDDGYLGSGTRLKSAINKYGKENFTRSILHLCLTEQDAYDKEAEIVTSEFVNRADTYNIDLGGRGSMRGRNHSKEARSKISESHKGLTHTEASKKKISEVQKGKTIAAETIAKIVAANTGKKRSPESLVKMSSAQKGRVASTATREKQSEAHKGKTASIETRNKMSDVRKGHYISPETKAKIAASVKASHAKRREERMVNEE